MKKEDKKRLEFYGGMKVSFIPLLIFVFFCVLLFVVLKVYAMEGLCMGAVIALMIGSFFAKNWSQYWESAIEGMTSDMINYLALILLVVGMFAKLMQRGGVAEGFVWFGTKLGLAGGGFVVFVFVATCIISTATGTSLGTLFSAFPIFYPSGILLGADPVILAGAILSGAIFGDNVGPISDTTIASSGSQSYYVKNGSADIAGVVASRMRYALVAAAIASVLFFFLGGSGVSNVAAEEILVKYSNPKGLIMLIPVIVLLSVAFYKRDIFIAVTWGIITGLGIGLASGILKPEDVIGVNDGVLTGFAIDGVMNMIGLVGYLYALAAIIGILKNSGMLETIIEKLMNSKLCQTEAGTEIVIGLGIMFSSIILGSANGPAIVMFGPVANDLGRKKHLHPYRRANLLDGLASTLPVVIPFTSSFIYIAMSCVTSLQADYDFIHSLSPFSIAGATFHCFTLFIVFLYAIFSGWGRRYEGNEGRPTKDLEESQQAYAKIKELNS